MSTLKLTNISNVAGTSSIPTDTVINGTPKAWVNFNGSNGAIRASFNVSSVTRSSVGDYNVNFTSAFADTNYLSVGTSCNDGAARTDLDISTTTTTYQRFMLTRTGTNTVTDALVICLAFFR